MLHPLEKQLFFLRLHAPASAVAAGERRNRLQFESVRLEPILGKNSAVRFNIHAKARHNAREESAKIQNRRLRKKFNGTAAKPRLSVFCSGKQLYAMLVDDSNKKCLFYGSTLQTSIREGTRSTIDAAACVGDEVVKACIDRGIVEISSYDRNGFACGERMQAFEIAIGRHGFLTR